MQGNDAAKLPASQDRLGRAGQVVGKGQLPNVADHQTVANVLNTAAPVVRAPMPGILALAAGAVGLIFLIVDHVRPVVCGREAESFRQAVLESRLQGVIDAVAIGRQQPDAPKRGIGSPRLDVPRAGIGTIEVQLAGVQEGPFVSHVADLQSVVPAQLP